MAGRISYHKAYRHTDVPRCEDSNVFSALYRTRNKRTASLWRELEGAALGDALSGKSSRTCHSGAAARVSGVQLLDGVLT